MLSGKLSKRGYFTDGHAHGCGLIQRILFIFKVLTLLWAFFNFVCVGDPKLYINRNIYLYQISQQQQNCPMLRIVWSVILTNWIKMNPFYSG